MNGRESMSEDISIKQHFSLQGKRAIVIGAEDPAGAAIASA